MSTFLETIVPQLLPDSFIKFKKPQVNNSRLVAFGYNEYFKRKMTVPYKNTEIFYTLQGSGSPLILLHGFLESTNIWREFTANYSGKHQLICIDLPGHGKSGILGEVHTMEEMAEAVHHVLQELKIIKAGFIGHSMGGYVVLAFLEKYPEIVEKLILLNSTPTQDSEERKTNRERSIALVQKNKQGFVSMAISNLLTPENFQKFKKELEEIKLNALQFPTKGITAALEGMKIRPNRTGVLKRFNGEKIILTGKQDPILNCEELKRVAEETRCGFYTFPDGHLSFIENKDELLKVVYFIE